MNCPNCSLEIELHLSSSTGERVKEEVGDIGICFDCGQQMMFDGADMVAIDAEGRQALPVMSRLQLHWQWVKWDLKSSIRGN